MGRAPAGLPNRRCGRRVDGFLAAVANGDEKGYRRYVDVNAEAMKTYLRLAQGVPGSESACGFVGATGERVAALSVGEVTVTEDEATVAFDGNPTVMHLSESNGRWVIDGIT